MNDRRAAAETARRPTVGVVVIGRNEGARIARCLDSLDRDALRVVYVDSGSTDGSPGLARERGVAVVELDPSRPFSAARARNAGLDRLVQEEAPRFVQFVDGDCRLAPRWIEQGVEHLEGRPGVAVVAGDLEEGSPPDSVFHDLLQREWRAPAGPVDATGGVFLARTEALRAVGGFLEWIAGEEPELCFRLRRAGWALEHLATPMAVHDGGALRLRGWWRRSIRSGHASAQCFWEHGRSPERFGRRRVLSALGFGFALPVGALALAVPTKGLSLLLLGVLPLQALRVALRERRQGTAPAAARAYALFTVLGKLPESLGVLRFFLGLVVRRPSRIIESRTPSTR